MRFLSLVDSEHNRSPRSGVCFIHKLHDDILYDVFFTSSYSEECLQPYAAHISGIIAQVCRRWRAIAIRSPALWDGITIDTWHTPARTARWISLSGQAELTVEWNWDMDASTEDMRIHAALLGPHARRICVLYFRIDSSTAPKSS